MIPVKTVLCPVDRSDISRRAFEYATAIASRFEARLTVIEVIDLEMTPDDVQSPALVALNEFAAPARAAGIATEVTVETGDVVTQILDRAEDTSADLVVMGTHGRSGFERLALGSVAEKVVRRAVCPVLTVPPGDGRVTASPFNVILCSTDFSEPSTAAVQISQGFAKAMGGRVVLTHVVEWSFGDTVGDDPVSELRRSLEAEARDQLARLVKKAGGSGVAIETVVRTGSPKREIVALAHDRNADLIVMGLSGRGAIDLAILGSTANSVIREAHCPVLTVRVRTSTGDES